MYREHRKEYLKFLEAQAVLNDIIFEYDRAFQKTQPHSLCYEVKAHTRVNRVEEFVIEVERKNLYRRSEDAKQILNTRRFLLNLKEAELRKSYDIHDILYVAKWVDNKEVSEITRNLGYSTSQIYQIINQIKKEVSLIS